MTVLAKRLVPAVTLALVIAGCSSTAQQSATPSSPSTPDTSPGVTTDSIYVGVPYPADADAANKAAGAGGVTVGNPKADAQIVIDDINANGGVAGHKLVPVFDAIPSSGAASVDALEQAECTKLTKDNKVFAVLDAGEPALMECLGKAGVVAIDDDVLPNGEASFRKYPFWVSVSQINQDRVAKIEVKSLSDQGYFQPWDTKTGAPGGSSTRIGVVTLDQPDFAHAVDQVLIPDLTAAGQPKPDVVRVNDADTAAMTAAVKNAVLKFRTDKVDHVLIFEYTGVLGLFFTKEAETQNYHPRYGVNSGNGPQVLIDGAGVPKEQFKGAVGFGWNPVLDLRASQNPLDGPYSSQARRHCRQLLTSKGARFPDANAEAVGNLYCNSLYLLRDALKSQGGKVSRGSFFAGLHALGSSFEPAGAFSTNFSPDQHDGGNGYYHYAYDESCGCFGYSGSQQRSDG
jgi:hypothetical protein